MHGTKIGPDGRLYWTIADTGAHVTTKEGKVIDNPDSGAVFRCDPDGANMELFAYGLRNPQSLAFNDLGDLFTGDNNADGGDKARWTHVVEDGDYGWRIGWQFLPKLGPWNSEGMWHLDNNPTNLALLPPVGLIGHGPAGIAHYPGTGLPDGYADHFFYADFPGGVRSFALKPKGASYTVDNPNDVLQDNKPAQMTGKLLWNLYPSDERCAVQHQWRRLCARLGVRLGEDGQGTHLSRARSRGGRQSAGAGDETVARRWDGQIQHRGSHQHPGACRPARAARGAIRTREAR
jgi:quinoprotein glucose dehydrogenase